MRGRTAPNPCLRCNEKIKFAAVPDPALALGFDAVCTGHYARIDGDGALDLRPVYVLAVLTRNQIAHAISRWATRRKAAGPRGGPGPRPAGGMSKPDSHDVCFIADWRAPAAPRPARQLGAAAGQDRRPGRRRSLGEHDGTFYGYTVGQRKGLRVDRPAPGRPAAVRARHRAGDQDRHGGLRPAAWRCGRSTADAPSCGRGARRLWSRSSATCSYARTVKSTRA